MPTDKPRFSVTFKDESFDKIKQYQAKNRISTQSKAVSQLVELALNDIEQSDHEKNAPSLSDEAQQVAKVYSQLDSHGQGAVKAILDFEHAAVVAEKKQKAAPGRPNISVVKRSDGFVELKVYDQPAAAGLGNYLDDPVSHIEQYPANVIPDGTDFGIRISGQSMAPDIRDGSTVFVQSRSSIDPGKIGIFLLNGEALCKKLMVDKYKYQIRLVSLNPDFEDRHIEKYDEFLTLGLVLGSWPK